MQNHQFYIVENEVYSFLNFNTRLIPKILSIMYGRVHFQECFNRDGGYYSNMIFICRISQLFRNFDQNLLEIFQNLVDYY